VEPLLDVKISLEVSKDMLNTCCPMQLLYLTFLSEVSRNETQFCLRSCCTGLSAVVGFPDLSSVHAPCSSFSPRKMKTTECIIARCAKLGTLRISMLSQKTAFEGVTRFEDRYRLPVGKTASERRISRV